jgi:hypothetical protein
LVAKTFLRCDAPYQSATACVILFWALPLEERKQRSGAKFTSRFAFTCDPGGRPRCARNARGDQ